MASQTSILLFGSSSARSGRNIRRHVRTRYRALHLHVNVSPPPPLLALPSPSNWPQTPSGEEACAICSTCAGGRLWSKDPRGADRLLPACEARKRSSVRYVFLRRSQVRLLWRSPRSRWGL